MADDAHEPTSEATILVVEDEEGMRRLLEDELSEQGYAVRAVASLQSAVETVESVQPDLAIVDLRLPDGHGLELLPVVRSVAPNAAFVVVTAFGSVTEAVEALKAGADDFLTKPLDLDHLRLRLQRILEVQRLKGWVRASQQPFHGIIGRSAPMRRLFERITQLAGAAGPVLILGESGVGKEMVAHAIHAESERAGGPFVAVNCAALPQSLVESELFGHAAGAFTGADRRRAGLFQAADGGTLLLDELAELPLPVQAKLLRTLQDGTVRKVGADTESTVDVRVLAATNHDVEQQVATGALRNDLYYRLETFVLEVPALRERREDIERLAAHFLARFRVALDKKVDGFSSSALDALRSYDYPGNVRELESIVERAVTFCDGEEIRPEHLGSRVVEQHDQSRRVRGVVEHLGGPADELPTLEEVKRGYARLALERMDGNKRRAASALDIGRRTLYRLLDPDET